MQSADFLSAVFFYLKVGENLNQNWIVENLNNAFSTWNGKLGELWGLVTTGPQTFKGGAVWSVMQTLHNGMVGIGYALVYIAMQKHNEFSRVKMPRSCNPLLSPLCGGKSACGIRHGHYAECVFDL